jgi:hypothetical protein
MDNVNFYTYTAFLVAKRNPVNATESDIDAWT